METTQRRGDLLVRAVWTLETLAGMEQPATLPALARRLHLPVTQTYRVLRALQRDGFVDHVGRRGYRIGARGLSLGALLGVRPEIREPARPVLTRLAATTGAAARFHLRSGDDRVLLLAAVPPGRRDPDGEPVLGERASLTRGCAGRAILAHLPSSEIEVVLAERPGATDRAELARIRRDGVAFSRGDNHEGLSGIAVPLLAPDDGGPLGSLSLAAPGDAVPRHLTGPLTAAAAELAGPLATVLGPAATSRRRPLDVGVLLDDQVSSRSSRCPGR